MTASASSNFTKGVLDKIFPDHWSFMLGEIALYCFIILVLTGVVPDLLLQPEPAGGDLQRGVRALAGRAHVGRPTARSSTSASKSAPASSCARSTIGRRWCSSPPSSCTCAAIFFTGAFRRPREINWIVGVSLLLLAMGNGFTGYSLPDDLLSGTGLRIMFSIILSIPFIGPWLAFLIFGGPFPGTAIIQRLFIIHVLFIPVLIGMLLGAHLAILWHQKHTDFPGRGKTEETIARQPALAPVHGEVGGSVLLRHRRRWPRSGAWCRSTRSGCTGRTQPAVVSSGSQPDWYIGWLDGALRIMPPVEIHVFNHTIANPFFPGVLMPGITFGVLYAWPFLEARFTKDRIPHDLLDRPRDRPARTAFGAATLSFYTVLFLAAGTDVLATIFGVSFEALLRIFQISCIAVPAGRRRGDLADLPRAVPPAHPPHRAAGRGQSGAQCGRRLRGGRRARRDGEDRPGPCRHVASDTRQPLRNRDTWPAET